MLHLSYSTLSEAFCRKDLRERPIIIFRRCGRQVWARHLPSSIDRERQRSARSGRSVIIGHTGKAQPRPSIWHRSNQPRKVPAALSQEGEAHLHDSARRS